MYHIPRLSKTVYIGLCQIIGNPTEVGIRRDVDNTEEAVRKAIIKSRGHTILKSGSNREGFRFSTSDVDLMACSPNVKVISKLSQVRFFNNPKNTLILMECDDLPPGFTRLKLISPSNTCDPIVWVSRLVINNECYISSSVFRNSCLRFLQSFPGEISSSIAHGPCTSYKFDNGTETDFLSCMQSQLWPTIAVPWIRRCRQQGWPSEDVVSDILSGGFHVVPIGSTPENGLEWRISFSQAEQKLIHSMNHCQFLCYGLLKIFLKEVINSQEENPVLCSYFLKTIVFWEVQTNNSMPWAAHDLLSCFWRCFKLLIHWVRIGYCPNFFIAQNNMFRQKVTGTVQTSLYNELYDLYCKGISCLLFSQSIRPFLSYAILNRKVIPCTCNNSIISSFLLDRGFFTELLAKAFGIINIKEFAVLMKQIEDMVRDTLTPYQAASLQLMTAEVLRNTAMLIQNSFDSVQNRNKVFYKAKKVYILLKLSCAFGDVSNILYLAMYLYKIRRYEHSLQCLRNAHVRMSLAYSVYIAGIGNMFMYMRHMFGLSGEKVRRASLDNFSFHCFYTYIDELILDQKVSCKNGRFALFIPPFVMLHMLFILNHQRRGDTVRSQQSLQDLQTLIHYDNNIYVPHTLRDISWQILGICQQICGDGMGSLESYRYSLQQIPSNQIQEATLLRIESLFN